MEPSLVAADHKQIITKIHLSNAKGMSVSSNTPRVLSLTLLIHEMGALCESCALTKFVTGK